MKFFSIRHKLALVYLFVIVEIFAVLLLTRYYWTIPQFISLEQVADQKDINRIANIINGKVDELALVNYDNAVWTESFLFVEQQTASFIDDNFVSDTFQSLNINGLYYYDLAGNKVWGSSFDLNKKDFVGNVYFDTPPEWFKQQLLFSTPDRQKPETHKGIIFIDNQPVLFAATTVMHSSATGASNGTLLFYRQLTTKEEAQFSELAATQLEFVWPFVERYSQHLEDLSIGTFATRRDENNQLTLVQYDFLNQTPYFVKINAGERAFDNTLLDNSITIAFICALLGLLYLFHFIARRVLRPILRWQQLLATIVDSHDYSVRFTERGNDELSKLSKAFNKLMCFVEERDNEVKAHNARLEELSNTDGLTKVFNRRYFDNFMHQLWNDDNTHQDVCLCMIDIDFFKKYNDHYGHQQGDEALIQIGEILQTNTKRSSDTVARYGGEEFVLVFRNTTLANGIKVAENLRSKVELANIEHKKSPLGKVTISIGISHCLPSEYHSPRVFIHLADEALYQAKEKGKNQVVSTE